MMRKELSAMNISAALIILASVAVATASDVTYGPNLEPQETAAVAATAEADGMVLLTIDDLVRLPSSSFDAIDVVTAPSMRHR